MWLESNKNFVKSLASLFKTIKPYQWAIILLVIVNVLIRFNFIHSNRTIFPPLGGDAAGYDYYASNFCHWLFGDDTVRPPVYIFFLKGVYFFVQLFSLDKLPAVYFVQVMIDVVTLLLVLQIIEIIFLKLAGKNLVKIIYAVFHTLYFPFVINSAVLLRATLNNFLTALFLLFLLKFHTTADWNVKFHLIKKKLSFKLNHLYFLLFCAFFVMSYLNREDNFLYLFFILAIFGYLYFYKKKRKFKNQAISFLILIFIFNLPWLLRNIIFAHDFVLLSNQSGISIALGHMYDYPIFDDLRCPYLSSMFSIYGDKSRELGSGFNAAIYFVRNLWRTHSFAEIGKFYINKVISMFKNPLILFPYSVNLGFYTIYMPFVNKVHQIFLKLFIISFPLLWIYRRAISPYFVYIGFVFIIKICTALLLFGCPRYGYSMAPYIILLAAFSTYVGLKTVVKLFTFIKEVV